uniref:Choline transporter-like protein 4 n=1 Tax=Gadus morhua TaxID=8049 RepID=A0A8C5A8U2_GADMO
MGKKKDSDPDSKEYGEAAQFDPTFHGPIHNRSCTDIICCVLFMLVILGYMVVGIIAWLYGDPRHVLYPRNSTGSFCVTRGLLLSHALLFYYVLLYSVLLCNTLLCSTLLCSAPASYSATALLSVLLFTQPFSLLHCALPYCTLLCFLLLCTVLFLTLSSPLSLYSPLLLSPLLLSPLLASPLLVSPPLLFPILVSSPGLSSSGLSSPGLSSSGLSSPGLSSSALSSSVLSYTGLSSSGLSSPVLSYTGLSSSGLSSSGLSSPGLSSSALSSPALSSSALSSPALSSTGLSSTGLSSSALSYTGLSSSGLSSSGLSSPGLSSSGLSSPGLSSPARSSSALSSSVLSYTGLSSSGISSPGLSSSGLSSPGLSSSALSSSALLYWSLLLWSLLSWSLLLSPPLVSPLLDSPPLLSPPLLSPLLVSPPLVSPLLDSPPLLSPPLVSPLLVSPPLVSPLLDSPLLDSPPLLSPPLLSPPLVSPLLVSPPLVSPLLVSPLLVSPLLDSPPLLSPPLLSPPLVSPLLLSGLVISMLVSMLFLLLLRFTAPVMVWLLILGLLGAGGIWHCYWEYDNYKTRAVSITDIGFTTNLEVYLQTQETWLAFLIIIAVAEAIILLTVIFLRKRILIAIALIQEASRAVGHMMSTLLYPLVTFVLVLVCVAYWGITALYLATSGAPIYRVVALNVSQGDCERYNGTQECDPLNFNSSSAPGCPSARCIFIRYNDEGLLQRNIFNLQIYNAVAFLWCVNFVIALGQCTLAGAFASYYWAFSKPSDIPYFPLSSAFIRTLRYHVGSLAFGALILTLVQIVRILLEYIDHKTRCKAPAQNPCARFLMCCLKCCFWCLEKFIKFLNRNAYIMIAVYGKNFCVSAKNAFFLLMRNIIRSVPNLLVLFGSPAVLSFFFFSGRIPLPGETFRSENLNYYWMPIITVAIGSYLIAHGFFSVYNMCVDTLFLCFLEDLERNDGSQERPYYMSKNLMKILNKSNKGAK